MKTKVIIVAFMSFVVFGNVVQGQKITIPAKGNKLSLSKFDKKISDYETFEVENNRDKAAGELIITFNDSCTIKVSLPEIDKGKSHTFKSVDVPKELKDCYKKSQVAASIVIGKDTLKNKFSPIKTEPAPEVLRRPTITILKDNKLNVVGFDNKKMADFVVTNQQNAAAPKITLSFEDCEVKLNLPSLNKDQSHLVDPKSLNDSDKKCYAGTLKKIVVELGKQILEKEFEDPSNEEDNNDFSFIPKDYEKSQWLSPNEGCTNTPPPLSDHTRFALIYDFDCPDFITMWKNKKNGVVQTKKVHPKYYRSVLLLVKNFHPYRDSISVAVSYSNRFLEHAATFTTAFNTNFNLSDTEAIDDENTAESSSKDGKDKTIIEKFTILREELKAFYTTTWNQSHLSVAYLDKSVTYINSRLNEVFGITDYSPNGIIDAGLKHIGKLPDGSNAEDFIEIVRDAARYYKLVVSYRVFDSHSFLIKNRDEINFQVNKFRDKHKVTLEQEEKNLQITGGVKIDFSLGLFSTGLMDKMFTSTSVSAPSDTTFLSLPNGVIDFDSIVSINRDIRKDSILRDDHGRFSYGPAVFSHVYWRSGSFINVGVTFGFSIDQQATPRYLLGGSIMLGNHQRFVMSGGVAFGQRKQLASGLKEGQLVTLSSYPNSTLPTTDRSDTSWFFSISYNFTGFSVGGNGD